jgi:hypothetical protein
MKLDNMPDEAHRLQFLRDAYERTNELITQQEETISSLHISAMSWKKAHDEAWETINEQDKQIQELESRCFAWEDQWQKDTIGLQARIKELEDENKTLADVIESMRNESMGTMNDKKLKQQYKMVDSLSADYTYITDSYITVAAPIQPYYHSIEIEQNEFNVVVMKYYSWSHKEELARFPYGYKSDEDSSEVAVQKAKDFIDLWKLNKPPYEPKGDNKRD